MRSQALPASEQLLSLLDANDPRIANLYGAFCIAHPGCLQTGEITLRANELIHGHTKFAQSNPTRRSIQFREDQLLLKLPSSNTDPFRKGVMIRLSASTHAACQVIARWHLYELCPSRPHTPLPSPAPHEMAQ
jgi:hypothetical protein